MTKLITKIGDLLPRKVERGLRRFWDTNFRKYKLEKLPKEIYDPNLTYYSISFCTTCMNRLYQLKETYIKNIEDNINYPKIEFVLLNYNSKDNLNKWVKKNLSTYIKKGIVNYYVTDEPKSFHASKAKNLAHKVAQNEILVNLDGDNFLGNDFAYYVNYLFNKHGLNVLLQCKKEPFWDIMGRIALTRENFFNLGGYDESFLPHASQDTDLVERATAYGLNYYTIQVENFFRYLSNSKKEKVRNIKNDGQDYWSFYDYNRQKSKDNIESGELVANKNGWGKSVLFKNFSNNSYSS